MRAKLSLIVLCLALVGVAGTAIAQPCQPRCLAMGTETVDGPDEAGGQGLSLIPVALVALALTLRRSRL